jgi:hypothetical protein
MKLPLFLMVFVNVYIHFRIWIRIRNPRVTDPDPAKVPDPCGSRSTTLTGSHCRNVLSLPFKWMIRYRIRLCDFS